MVSGARKGTHACTHTHTCRQAAQAPAHTGRLASKVLCLLFRAVRDLSVGVASEQHLFLVSGCFKVCLASSSLSLRDV